VVVALAAAITAGTAGPALAAATTAGTTASAAPRVPVIVTEQPGAGDGPQRAVQALGGSVGRQLGLVHAFTAQLPADRLDALRATPGVTEVTPDAAVHLASTEVADQTTQTGSLDSITRVVGASSAWARGITGRGVDVALIDSGVVPVDGLRTPGKVVQGPDLSLESQQCDGTGSSCTASPAQGLDGYGHGTAMAGIIAGRDDAAPATLAANSGKTDFLGVAPDARVVSVKVADAGGTSDVSQVIAGIDWVVQNKDRGGLHIRVLNLSFGTDGVQDYQLDPLTYAVEVAWRAGIVVVVSAGNAGSANGKLADPAYDPYVLAVGAVDDHGTGKASDDVIPSWSSKGDGVRNPDVVAPGAGVVGLRDPGGFLDTRYPDARVGSRFFRGSGTSQAAAVVSGAAALLLSAKPQLTNDQVKALLTGSAKHIPSADRMGQGHGLLDLGSALSAHVPSAAAAAQNWPRSTGTGSLEAARGTVHAVVGGTQLTGETSVDGSAWNGAAEARAAAAGTSWSGTSWNGQQWSGQAWNADHFAGQTWNGTAWTDVPWLPDADGGYSAKMWAGRTWTATMWASSNWDATMWAAKMWAATMWASDGWA
jgi:serine protease AprX